MAGNVWTVSGSCRELQPGDAIEVFCGNTLVRRGPVLGADPGQGLVWMLDTLTGRRCMVDLSGVEVVRLPPAYREVSVRNFRP